MDENNFIIIEKESTHIGLGRNEATNSNNADIGVRHILDNKYLKVVKFVFKRNG